MNKLTDGERAKEEIDYILGIIDVGTPVRTGGSKLHCFKPSYFKRIEPVAEHGFFSHGEDWFVFDDTHPSLSLVTDPEGAMAMFKDRARPQAGNRRTQLRNWVEEHYRQGRSNPGALVYVKEHLRGAVSFKWYGYNCVIYPAAYDLDKAKGGKS